MWTLYTLHSTLDTPHFTLHTLHSEFSLVEHDRSLFVDVFQRNEHDWVSAVLQLSLIMIVHHGTFRSSFEWSKRRVPQGQFEVARTWHSFPAHDFNSCYRVFHVPVWNNVETSAWLEFSLDALRRPLQPTMKTLRWILAFRDQPRNLQWKTKLLQTNEVSLPSFSKVDDGFCTIASRPTVQLTFSAIAYFSGC